LSRTYQGTTADAAGFILAGGQSSRMGSDKALVLLCGEPLIAHAIGILRRVGLPISIAGARSSLSDFAPVLEDAGGGPLRGICSGLAATFSRFAVFLSVDMPLIPVALVEAIRDSARLCEAGVTLCSVNGFTETFPCVVDRDLLPALELEVQDGNTGCFSALRAAAGRMQRPVQVVVVEYLVQTGHIECGSALPPVLWFLNVNTPTDLARAESLLAPIA
jgi:molybdopterin-guanine dinucleotide biosynthesis protein A